MYLPPAFRDEDRTSLIACIRNAGIAKRRAIIIVAIIPKRAADCQGRLIAEVPSFMG